MVTLRPTSPWSSSRLALNKYILRSTFVGALGGLLFGIDTAVIAGTTAGLTHTFGLTVGQLGFTVAIGLIGTVFGAISAGPLGQKFGSREMLRVTAILYLLASLGCGFAPSWGVLLAARFVLGLGIGASSVIGPVYIAELAPANLRGRLVGTFQINIVLGILLAYLSNYVISLFNLGAVEWRWQLGIASVPALIFLGLLYTIPRSSRWLTTQNRLEEAKEVLEMLGSPNSEAELAEIRESLHLELTHKKTALFERLNGRFRYGKPILLAVAIGFFNQVSGINAILYYINDIFGYAGFGHMSGNIQAVAVGFTNLLFTVIGMSVIDKFGRRPLLLTGAVGTSVMLLATAMVFYTQSHYSLLVWTLIGFIAFFAISQGACIWVYLAEIFPTRVRNKGQAVGSGTHWVMATILAQYFPVVAKNMGKSVPFFFFAGCSILGLFVILFAFPETKQVSLEELQKKLRIE